MRMKRQFLSVGQGAFYCESFWLGKETSNPINVVFDCGVLPSRNQYLHPQSKAMHLFVDSRIVPVIPSEITNSRTIHAVFLSHLHEDHVNGLAALKRQGIQIKKVYYPAVDEAERQLMFVWYKICSQDAGLAQTLCMDQPTTLSDFGDTLWIPVPSGVPEEEESDVPLADTVLPNVPSGQNIPLWTWEFLTFNFKRRDAIKALKRAWASAGLPGTLTNANLMREWNSPGGVQRVKQVYKLAFPNRHFNTNSMTVFSGVDPQLFPNFVCQGLIKNCTKKQTQNGYQKFCRLNFPSGCLYTGDYDASDNRRRSIHWKYLRSAYRLRWPHVGCLQIPHHGSEKGFNRKFLKLNAIFVASMGQNNQYGHPSAKVVKDFKLAKKHLIRVTEKTNSQIELGIFPHFINTLIFFSDKCF